VAAGFPALLSLRKVVLGGIEREREGVTSKKWYQTTKLRDTKKQGGKRGYQRKVYTS
jgi:hypothetical protein